MKLKLILSTAILGAALAVPSTSSAQPPPATQDFAIGFGSTAVVDSFSFEVSSGPSGENPTGSGSEVFGGVPFTATHFFCLSVAGNVATSVSQLAANPYNINYALVRVADNGPAGSNLDTYDAYGFEYAQSPPPCSTPVYGFGRPLTSGDIVVRDNAPLLPTSKDQCKEGGWQNFPDFKNQGVCVAFVERGPGPQEPNRSE